MLQASVIIVLLMLLIHLKKKSLNPIRLLRDFKNVDWDSFNNSVEYTPWENILSVENINDKVTIFENYMNDILDKFAPFKTFTVKKPNHTPWIDGNIRKMMDFRDSLKNEFNVTGDLDKHDAYKAETGSHLRGDRLKVECSMKLSINQLATQKNSMKLQKNCV